MRVCKARRKEVRQIVRNKTFSSLSLSLSLSFLLLFLPLLGNPGEREKVSWKQQEDRNNGSNSRSSIFDGGMATASKAGSLSLPRVRNR